MRAGGKRRLVIPEALAYGEAGSPPKIPPKAGLKFDIELLALNPADAHLPPSTAEPDFAPPMDPDSLDDPENESPP
jgi:hypothetical protein